MADSKNIYQALSQVQLQLKAPKGQRNSFGNYNYRSCEDILEAVKPLLAESGLTLIVTDKLQSIGERYYIEAEATVTDGKDAATAYGFAREEETKKGMDGSQITGAASSYARKYALNGLFLIDDTKDADTDEHRKAVSQPVRSVVPTQPAQDYIPDTVAQDVMDVMTSDDNGEPTKAQLDRIREIRKELGYPESQTETKIKLLRTKAAAGASVGKLKAELEQFKAKGGSDVTN